MKFHKFSVKFLLRQGLIFALILSVVMPAVLIQPATIVYADKLGVCGIPGKDGPTITLNGVLNSYYPGAANVAAGATSIPVGTARAGGGTAIAAGDLLLVVQMQGADLDGNNDERYGDGVGTAGIAGDTVVFSAANAYAGGNLAANFSAGQYEYVVATTPVIAGSVTISSGLVNDYFSATFGTQGQRTFQVIRVPQYSNATLNGTVTALHWDGSTGGIVAFDVAGALDWNGNTVDVSTLGFRGGGGRQLTGNTGGANTDYRTLSTFNANGSKGEGYAGTPRYVNNNGVLLDNGAVNEGFLNGSSGRGASGNGGGGSTDGSPGSNSQNSGGGGGGNGGYGGIGGNTWNSGLIRGGFGGAPFPGSAPRLILGGGGGAGTTNDGTGVSAAGFASSGAAGGGVVMIRAGTIDGTGTINANGGTANQTVLNDGGGGGGAGGSVVVIARNGLGGVGALTITAVGGNGGVTWPLQVPGTTGAGFTNNHHGPGGGGGGGFIFTSGPLAASNVSGGLNGTSTNDNDAFGATPGDPGTLITNITPTTIPSSISGANCVPVALTTIKTTSTPNVAAGSTATYTITVSNVAGAGGASGVDISDVLPTGFTYASTDLVTLSTNTIRTVTTNPAVGATEPTWGTFMIPGGGSVSITFTVNVNAATPPGTYQNPATATFFDPVRTTPTATLTSTYDPASSTGEDVTVANTSSADLVVSKTDGVVTVNTGGTTTYTLTLTNNGPSPANNATISDPPAAGLTKTAIGTCTAAGGAVCPTVGAGAGQMNIANLEAGTVVVPTLPNGGSISFSLTVNVTATSGSVTNIFTATPPAGITDPTPATATDTDTVTATPLVDLSLTKTIDNPSPIIGDTVNYTITITNRSLTTAATNVVVDDQLPLGLAFNSATPSIGAFSNITGDWTITTLAANTSATLLLNVTVTQAGLITNTAEIVASDQPDPNSTPNNQNPTEDDQASVSFGGLFDPPTGIKSFTEAGLPVLEFRLVWINSGNTTAINVQVTDAIPTGTTYLNGSLTCAPQGSSTNAAAATLPLNTALVNSFCAFDPINNRIQWQGSIGSDNGNLTEAAAANEIVITFRVTVNNGVNQVLNFGTSRSDTDGDGDFTNETIAGISLIDSNQVVWIRNTSPDGDGGGNSNGNNRPSRASTGGGFLIPVTGFAPNAVTELKASARPVYNSTDFTIEIPVIKVNTSIVGVQQKDGSWDVSWLLNQVGWLNGTAYPTWTGNSVLTGHVVNINGKPGIFYKLKDLNPGEYVFVYNLGYRYTYKVVSNKSVQPDDITVLQHEDKAYLTLVTCDAYDEETGAYLKRIAVRAVLVDVREAK
jgi:LPXTG-site transpeptidase (sortase) family protein